MHEMSLLANLLQKIESLVSENKAKGVSSVKVKLGAFSHISADHFREHFEQGTKGTISEGATLFVEESKDTQDPHAQEILLQSVDLKMDDSK